MDWIREVPIAHRGLHDVDGGVPENSLAAFDRAAEAGFAIELDVQLTADGVVVVFHDDDLLRMTGHPGRVAGASSGELGALRLAGTAHRVPSLAEVLDLVDGRAALFVEVKNRGAPGPLEEAVAAELGPYAGPWAVGSFNPLSLAWFKESCPGVPRGQISGSLKDSDLDPAIRLGLQNLAMNPLTEPHFVAYELAALPHPAVTAAREAGLPVVAWTVRSVEDRVRAEQVADNIIFEGIVP